MTRHVRLLILVVVTLAAFGVVSLKQRGTADPPEQTPAVSPMESHEAAPMPALPRLVDVGADQCIPCKMMIPVLEALRTEYAGRLKVDVIDAWKYPAAAAPYRVYAIPTQIFYAPDGRELARHEGFISKADILAMWRKLGFDLDRPATGR